MADPPGDGMSGRQMDLAYPCAPGMRQRRLEQAARHSTPPPLNRDAGPQFGNPALNGQMNESGE